MVWVCDKSDHSYLLFDNWSFDSEQKTTKRLFIIDYLIKSDFTRLRNPNNSGYSDDNYKKNILNEMRRNGTVDLIAIAWMPFRICKNFHKAINLVPLFNWGDIWHTCNMRQLNSMHISIIDYLPLLLFCCFLFHSNCNTKSLIIIKPLNRLRYQYKSMHCN